MVTLTGEQIMEELARIGAVRLVIEPQGTGIVQEDAELIGETAAEKIGGTVIFFSEIRSYFCYLVAAFSPCHGRAPQRRYMGT
jgi:hypothetical protein